MLLHLVEHLQLSLLVLRQGVGELRIAVYPSNDDPIPQLSMFEAHHFYVHSSFIALSTDHLSLRFIEYVSRVRDKTSGNPIDRFIHGPNANGLTEHFRELESCEEQGILSIDCCCRFTGSRTPTHCKKRGKQPHKIPSKVPNWRLLSKTLGCYHHPSGFARQHHTTQTDRSVSSSLLGSTFYVPSWT